MSTETFWTRLGAYNEATLPIQAVMIIIFAAGVYGLIVLIKDWKARPSEMTPRQGEC
jgi:hypothetical protein